jgi:hypothetical protein
MVLEFWKKDITPWFQNAIKPIVLDQEKITTSALLRLLNRLHKLHGRVESRPPPEKPPSLDS